MKIRAVQLDLARQKETPEYVMSYTDAAHSAGFNTLLLYLEGKVRTPTFHFPAKNESYEIGDMERIVKHCRSKRVDVIPCVSTLGHTELFLKNPELRHLAELCGNQEGRWFQRGDLKMTCPSLDATYDFFADYLQEIAEIFPSRYFHLGLDESFELGQCKLCRESWNEKDGYASLFAKHIKKIHAIVTRLGKRMLMWDDLFEIYPQTLEMIPRDIILCCWCYDRNSSIPIYHFLQRKRHDPFKQYEKMGFDYIACPACSSAENITSLTRYAHKHKPMGMLLTQWEKSRQFYHSSLPLVTMAGNLWSGKSARTDSQKVLTQKAIRNSTGVADKKLQRIIANSLSLSINPAPRNPAYVMGLPDAGEEQTQLQAELLFEQLEEYLATDKQAVLQDIAANLLEQSLNGRIRIFAAQTVAQRFNLDAGGWHLQAKDILKDITRLRKVRHRQWQASRGKIPGKHLDTHFKQITDYVQSLGAQLKKQTQMLSVRFFLPDRYSAPFASITMLSRKGEIELCKHTSLKPLTDTTPYYEYFFPFRGRDTYQAIRLEIAGYGGQGLAYVKLVTPKSESCPDGIGKCSGIVSNPTAIIEDNLQWCYLGEHDASPGFKWTELGKAVNSIEVLLNQ